MAGSPLPRLRRMCLALPDATEKKAWGAPAFRVRNRMFATSKTTFITQEIEERLGESYRLIAGKRLIARLEEKR